MREGGGEKKKNTEIGIGYDCSTMPEKGGDPLFFSRLLGKKGEGPLPPLYMRRGRGRRRRKEKKDVSS